MSFFNLFNNLKNWFFTKYLVAFFITILASSLIVGLVDTKTKKHNSVVQTVNHQQKEEILEILKKFGNAYSLFSDTKLDLDLFESKFATKFKYNFQIIDSLKKLLPINFRNLDLNFIEQKRQKFINDHSYGLSKVVDAQKVLNYSSLVDFYSDMQTVGSSFFRIVSANPESVSFGFEDFFFDYLTINNFFQFLEQKKNFLLSDQFADSLTNFRKWILQPSYAGFLAKFTKIFKIASFSKYQDASEKGERENILLNFLLLVENLDLEDEFEKFFENNFNGFSNVSDIISQFENNKIFQKEVQNKLNSLEKEKRLDRRVREELFQIVTKDFAQKFFKELIFEKPSQLLLASNWENDLFFEDLIKSEKIGSFFNLVNLLFLDHLILNKKAIPQKFGNFLESFADFLKELDFQSNQFGYILDALTNEFKDSIIDFENTEKYFLDNKKLKNWILQAEESEFISPDDEIPFNSKNELETIQTIKNKLGEDLYTLENINIIFINLLKRNIVFWLGKNLLQKDEDNLVLLILQNGLFSLLGKIKVQFKESFEELKLLRFWTPNWELTSLDVYKTFNLNKEQDEKNLRNKIEELVTKFLTNKQNDDFDLLVWISSFLEATYKWLIFLWKELLKDLPFLDLNVFILAVLKFAWPDNDTAKAAVLFADFGKKEEIFDFFVETLWIYGHFWENFSGIKIDWKQNLSEIDFREKEQVFKKLAFNLGFRNNSSKGETEASFVSGSFLDNLLQSFRNKEKKTQRTNFILFLEKKIFGKNGFIVFLVSEMDNYLSHNFYSYLNPNFWDYQEINFFNFNEFLEQKNSLPFRITYTAVPLQAKEIKYHLVWEITKENENLSIQLVNLEKSIVDS